MSLSYKFRCKETNDTIIVSYGKIKSGYPAEAQTTSEVLDSATAFCQVLDYTPNNDALRKIQKLHGGRMYGVFNTGEPIQATTFLPLLTFNYAGTWKTWICDNGNYFKIRKNGKFSAPDYQAFDKENNLIVQWTTFNWFGNDTAVCFAYDDEESFFDNGPFRVNFTLINNAKLRVGKTYDNPNFDPFYTCLKYGGTIPEPINPDDPYDNNPNPSKPSTPEGEFPDNKGTWNDPDDPIDIPENPPFFGAGSSGFLTMYSPSWFQLNQLASFMWSEEFFNQVIKLWADPMQVIMGLNILPVKIPTSQNAEIMVGNVSSGVQAPLASQQYVYADMGGIELKPFYGSYMDYAPYTKITLVLPFIGAKELITDEVMGKVINVSYRIDILTGACIAYVKCGNAVLYQFSGNCGENIPITSASYTEMLNAYTKLAGDAASMAVTGGGAAGGNVISSSLNAIASIKPNISHTGTLASSCGAMGVLTPYIIKTKPNICMPKEQYKFEGFPSFVETEFSKCSGYTQVHSTRLQGIPATDEELEMIYNQLREGVVF